MPTYVYRCVSCNEETEHVHSIGDTAPDCHCGGHLKRRFLAPGVAFKGPGFYSTDNRKEK